MRGIQELDNDMKTYIIFNQGLHFNVDDHLSRKYIDVFAYHLLLFAKKKKDTVLIAFRETTAQHFSGSNGGLYDTNNRYRNVNSQTTSIDNYCCTKVDANNIVSNWRNIRFKESLDKLDSNWKSLIGWIPLFNLTLKYFDLHQELRYDNIDCTHFLYIPFMFLPLWRRTAAVLSKFNSN